MLGKVRENGDVRFGWGGKDVRAEMVCHDVALMLLGMNCERLLFDMIHYNAISLKPHLPFCDFAYLSYC